jgi:hypothetical protein
MTKIRCGKDIAIDLAQVVAWKKIKRLNSSEGTEFLRLILAGASSEFTVSSSEIGRPAFDHLHKLLLDCFAIDLANEYSISNSYNSVDEPLEPLELPF